MIDKTGKKKMNFDPEKMVKQIQTNLTQKIFIDEKVKQKLLSKEQQKIIKHKKIQEQLQKINQQNLLWMNKLQQFNKIIQNKKASAALKSSFEQQKGLLENYIKLNLQLQKIKAVKKQIRNLQATHWSEIQTKKSQISHVLKENKHQLISLIKKPSYSAPKSSKIGQKTCQNLHKQQHKKVDRKTKNIEQLKQLGRKYLQFAKKAQKSKSQKRLLNLQNKNIDYGHEMKELIKLKVDDLSKKPQFDKQDALSYKKRRTFKNTFTSASTLTQKTNEVHQRSRTNSTFGKLFEKKKSFSLKKLN